MKKLILLSVFLIFACSSDDSTQNFLEKYNGVAWKEDDGEPNYEWWYRFTPNSYTECEEGGSECINDCLTLNWDFVDNEGTYFRVIENLPEKLVIEDKVLDDDGVFEITTHTVTTINNGNGLEIRYSFDNSVTTYTRVSDLCSNN
jgi:hypothetical protein